MPGNSEKLIFRAIIALLVASSVSGCVGDPDFTSDSPTPMDTTTSTQVHAQGQIMQIIEDSSQVDKKLVNESYTYRKGKYNRGEGKAVAIIETGSNSEESGTKLYKVRINLNSNSVTSINLVENPVITTSS